MTGASRTCRCDEARGQAAVEQALTRAFWQSLDGQGPPAMAAREAAARTIGTLHSQVAAAHGAGSRCACGWVPDPDVDLIGLEAHLAAALLKPRAPELARMEVAGPA